MMPTLEAPLKRLSAIAKGIATLSLPVRLAVGALSTLIAGSVVGFFAEYAAYRWAIYYGVRPPLEGIPYLKVAITILTATILLGSALAFAVVQSFCTSLLRYLDATLATIGLIERFSGSKSPETYAGFFESMLARFRHFPPWKMILIMAILGAFAYLLSIGIDMGLGTLNLRPEHNLEPLVFALVICLLVVLVWRPAVQVWLSLTAVAGTVVVLPLLLFHVPLYGDLLRVLGYGGGLPVSVVVLEETASIATKTTLNRLLKYPMPKRVHMLGVVDFPILNPAF